MRTVLCPVANVNIKENAYTNNRERSMESEECEPSSCFWRIDVCGDLNAGSYDDDDACAASVAMSTVLQRAAVTNLPLLAYVYNHKYTDPAYNSVDGVTRRWREPSHFDVHGLVRLLGGAGLRELGLCEKLLEAVDSTHQLYLDDYHSWSFTQITEEEFNTMYEEDMDRASCDDI